MNRSFALLSLCLAFATIVRASPPPPLPWETSSFSVRSSSGPVEFRMDCPDGKLTRLSAARGQQVANFPVERLSQWELVGRCSGVSTNVERESEGSSNVSAIVLTVKLSQEYVMEELWITLDPNSLQFTEARWLLTYPGETTQVKRVSLQ